MNLRRLLLGAALIGATLLAMTALGASLDGKYGNGLWSIPLVIGGWMIWSPVRAFVWGSETETGVPAEDREEKRARRQLATNNAALAQATAHLDRVERDLRVGDRVFHASSGTGVVTGLESGGSVLIRFADDASSTRLAPKFTTLYWAE